MANSVSSSSSNPIPKSETTINDLPQHILIHIFIFLYLPEAIQTSLVSPSFRNLWHFLPSLHFDIVEFYSRSTSPTPRCDHSRNLFADFVTKTLISRQLNPLTKLQLTFEYANHDIHKFYVQSWIRYAINTSVSELILDFGDFDKFDEWKDRDDEADEEGHGLCTFRFYLSDIGKTHRKVLKLYKCDLMIPPKTNTIEFVTLKSLHISDTYFESDDVCDLLAKCVNLEILKFVKIEFSDKEVVVIHSSTLKELYLDLFSKCLHDWPLDLDICCPSLQKISLVSSQIGKVINKDTSNLVEACIDFKPMFRKEEYDESWEKMLGYFTNITNIDVWDELLESNEVPAGCERFASNVKHLELYCYYSGLDLVGVAALLKLLPKLEILGITNQSTIDVNLHLDCRKAATVFNMPCLKKLIMRSYHKTKREEHFIKLFKKNGIVLDKIELLPPSNQIKYYKYW